jgi:hypothetical protein
MLMLLFCSGSAVLLAVVFAVLLVFSWHMLLEADSTMAVHVG